MAVRAADRRRLRQVYVFACGYCGTSEVDSGAELTVDHFRPVTHGGSDDFSNLVYACHACNEYKSQQWSSEGDERILHPLNDPIQEHITERDDGVLQGLTATGNYHVSALELNRPPLVAQRQRRRAFLAFASLATQLSSDVTTIRALMELLLTQTDRGTPSE